MKILHLYYDSMNLYGDYANIEVLKKHLEDQGLEVVVDKKRSCVGVDFKNYDFIYIGSGTENAKYHVVEDLSVKRDEFIEAIEIGKIILLTGNAMEIVSQENLNIFDMVVEETDLRLTGDVVAKNNEFGEVIGFINKNSIIYDEHMDSLFEIEYEDINLDEMDYEGYRYNNLFGTHLIGPLLVKNHNMMEYMVRIIINQVDTTRDYKKIDYEYERKSYEIAINELNKRKKQTKKRKEFIVNKIAKKIKKEG